MAESKKKCRQYNIEYLKYGFIQSPTNITLPMCLICQKVFSNTETIDSAKLEEELIEVTTNEESKLKFKEGYQVF
ncbi:Hypothetical protein CINCED_3A024589 [Cinara cedri]|uniref:Uncharacterized protein n=1 Tax=Cinara cedri TaxID=506608 RepID=A0A5E4M758_9HEMI|nr:Hypothetical protein CINCED_3A024589 [Cinara cedri]